MELWNSVEGHAAVFRYKSNMPVKDGKPAGDWNLSTDVLNHGKTSLKGGLNHNLQIQNELLRPLQVRYHEEAVLTLDLETEVPSPVLV